MTLSQPTHPGRKMNYLSADSTSGADRSIAVSVHRHASPSKRPTRRLRMILALASLSAALFLLPGRAFAGDPTNAQYNAPAQNLQAALGGGQGGAPAQRVAVPKAAPGPTLPFTGLDVVALAAVAIALTGTGVVLRRLASIGDSEQ